MISLGAGLGALGAWGLPRFLAGQLYGVNPGDPPLFIAAPLLVAGFALPAWYPPARRASSVDPMMVLRYE
jgi:putative ABC transport system permease protein